MFNRKCWLAFTLIQMMVSFDYTNGRIDASSVELNTENCIMKMMRENFIRNKTVTIFSSHGSAAYSQIESNLIKNIFDLINCSVFICNTQMTYRKMIPFGVQRNFLIMLGDESLKATLDFLHSFYIWDSKAVFLVVVGNLKNQKGIIIANRTDLMNPRPYVLVVEVVSLNSSLQSISEYYVSMPSKVSQPERVFEKLRRIGSCDNESSYTTNSNAESEYGKKLRVGSIHAPPFLYFMKSTNTLLGSEILLIKTIVNKLNMTVEFQHYANRDNLGDVYVSEEQDVQGSGMLNDLLINKIDMAVGNIAISDKVSVNFAASTSYTVDQLVWVLPPPRSLAKLMFLPQMLGPKMTLFHISMTFLYPFLAFMATSHFSKSWHKEIPRYRTYSGTYIAFSAIGTGSTLDVYPKTIKMRFFLFMWLFYTYHMNMIFCSKLIDFFSLERYPPSLETIDEMLATDMQLGIDQRTVNFFKDQNIFTGKHNKSGRIFFCESTIACLSSIVRDRNFSMTMSYNYFKYAKHRHRDQNGKFLLALPQTIVSVPIGIVWKKGFALQMKINLILLRMNEAGLFNHWNDEIIQLLTIKLGFHEDNDEGGIDANYVLKFADYQTVFLGVAVQLFLCCLVFVGELLVHTWNAQIRLKRSTVDKPLFDYVN